MQLSPCCHDCCYWIGGNNNNSEIFKCVTMTNNVLLVQDMFQADTPDGSFYKPTGFISHVRKGEDALKQTGSRLDPLKFCLSRSKLPSLPAEPERGYLLLTS